MGYADHVSSPTRPACWGNPRSYDPNDTEECGECRFRNSCKAEVNSKTRVAASSNNSPGRTYYRPRGSMPNDEDVRSEYMSGIVEEGEKPFERFAKDAAAGALRGAFYEMYQFWRRYRIR